VKVKEIRIKEKKDDPIRASLVTIKEN